MSPIERYLVVLSRCLIGTGAAGRRLLLEASDHLYAAAADGVAAGQSRDEAEVRAVASFGNPDRIARQLRAVHWRSWFRSVGRAIGSALWLGAGWLSVVVGLAYVGYVLAVHGVAFGHLICQVGGGRYSTCLPTAGPALATGVGLLLGGAVVLLLRAIVVRRGWLRRVSVRWCTPVAVLTLAAGIVTAMDSGDPLVGKSSLTWDQIHILLAGILGLVTLCTVGVQLVAAIGAHLAREGIDPA